MTRIREFIKDYNGTQSELAKRLKTTPAAISNYANGKRDPGPKILAKICKELSVSSEWLLGLDSVREVSVIGHLCCHKCGERVDLLAKVSK